MRIVIVGAGGVGGLIGGLLQRSGAEVAFVARGAQLRALREVGLSVESPRGSFHLVRVEASDNPAALAPADALLVAVKAWQVSAVAPRLSGLLGPGGLAVPLENGVEAPALLARALGKERVAGGVCHVFAWVDAPGRVKHVGEILRVTMGDDGPRAAPSSARARGSRPSPGYCGPPGWTRWWSPTWPRPCGRSSPSWRPSAAWGR